MVHGMRHGHCTYGVRHVVVVVVAHSPLGCRQHTSCCKLASTGGEALDQRCARQHVYTLSRIAHCMQCAPAEQYRCTATSADCAVTSAPTPPRVAQPLRAHRDCRPSRTPTCRPSTESIKGAQAVNARGWGRPCQGAAGHEACTLGLSCLRRAGRALPLARLAHGRLVRVWLFGHRGWQAAMHGAAWRRNAAAAAVGGVYSFRVLAHWLGALSLAKPAHLSHTGFMPNRHGTHTLAGAPRHAPATTLAPPVSAASPSGPSASLCLGAPSAQPLQGRPAHGYSESSSASSSNIQPSSLAGLESTFA